MWTLLGITDPVASIRKRKVGSQEKGLYIKSDFNILVTRHFSDNHGHLDTNYILDALKD